MRFLFKKKEKEETEDFSDKFAALFERVMNLERRVEALEQTVGKVALTPQSIVTQPVGEGISRGRTRRPFLEE